MCLDPKQATKKLQGGFSLVTAIFILVILATLGAFMVTFSTGQQSVVAMDIQSARALQAARAGIEWAAYQVQPAQGGAGLVCPLYPAAPQIYTMSFTGSTLSGFSTSVSCNSSTHQEGVNATAPNTTIVYVLTSTATYGSANTPDYVSRQITARIAVCTEGTTGAAC